MGRQERAEQLLSQQGAIPCAHTQRQRVTSSGSHKPCNVYWSVSCKGRIREEVINTCKVCLWRPEEANGEPVPLSRGL